MQSDPNAGEGHQLAKVDSTHGDLVSEKDRREFVAHLPHLLQDLTDRWLIVRRRGCPSQDLRELLGSVQYLNEGLKRTPLTRLLAALRKIEERWRFHSNAMAPLEAHDQEMISALILGLRSILENELTQLHPTVGQGIAYPWGPNPHSVGLGMTGSIPEQNKISGPLIYLLEADAKQATRLIDGLGGFGFGVQHFSDALALETALSAHPPKAIIADFKLWHRAYQCAPALVARGDDFARDMRVFYSADTVTDDLRVRAVRAGGDALLLQPINIPNLLGRLNAYIQNDHRHPLKVAIFNPPNQSADDITRALVRGGLTIETIDDPLASIEVLSRLQPNAIIMPWTMAGLSSLDLARAIRQESRLANIPIMFLIDRIDPEHELSVIALGNADFLLRNMELGRLLHWVRARASAHRRDDTQFRVAFCTDGRTGLYSFPCFEKAVPELLAVAPSGSDLNAIMHIELDHFDQWALTLPSEKIDLIQTQVGRLIAGYCGIYDAASNLGQGSFILFTRCTNTDEALELAQDLRQAITHSSNDKLFGKITLKASIGIGFWDQTSEDFGKALLRAKRLCSDAQQIGGDRIRYFIPEVEKTISEEERQHWAQLVRASVTERKLFLVFQPIASLAADAGIERFEILLRRHPEPDETVSVTDLFRMAAATGQSTLLDRWVIYQALSALARYQKEKPGAVFFVKICNSTLLDPDFDTWFRNTLQRFQPEPESLVLQVSAADVIANPGRVRELLVLLHELSVRIAMEHFGLHEDSIRLIQELKPDYIKLHSQLTRGLSAQSRELVNLQRLLHQAQAHGVKTMAAYIEDADGLALLWRSRVDLIQGNFLKQPDPVISHDIAL